MSEVGTRKRRLTSKDVAAHAGVSQSIVSFYFTGKRPVSKEARLRIEHAIGTLGYRPNRVARSLRTQSSRQIAVFIPYISNPLYAAYAAGAEIALAEAGYLTIILSNRAVPAQIDAYFEMVADSQVDGLILFPFLDDVPRIERLRAAGVPIVFVDRSVEIAPDGPPVDSVIVDNAGSVRSAVGKLIAQGHHRIALITSANTTYGSSRIAGYTGAFADAGLIPDPALILEGGGRVEDGFTMATELLAREARPSALVVTMNMPTLGALEALRRANLRIPEDLSFIGFDTDDATHHLPEPVAAIRYPAIRLGRESAQLLVRRLGEDIPAPARHLSMGADLFLGSSTAPPFRE